MEQLNSPDANLFCNIDPAVRELAPADLVEHALAIDDEVSSLIHVWMLLLADMNHAVSAEARYRLDEVFSADPDNAAYHLLVAYYEHFS